MALSKQMISIVLTIMLSGVLAQDHVKAGYLPPTPTSSKQPASNNRSPPSYDSGFTSFGGSASGTTGTGSGSAVSQSHSHSAGASSHTPASAPSSAGHHHNNDFHQSNPIGTAAVTSDDQNAIILKDINFIDVDGSYNFEYETSNGIRAQEQGHNKDLGNGETAEVADGGFSYTAPDGQVITLQYTADETGFHPVGDHLPTPPPIPEAIQRALEYIQAHGGGQDEQYYR